MSSIDEELRLDEYEDESVRLARREERRRAMHRRKRIQIITRRIVFGLVCVGLILGIVAGVKNIVKRVHAKTEIEQTSSDEAPVLDDDTVIAPTVEEVQIEEPVEEEPTYVNSEYGPYAQQYSEEKNIFYAGYDVNILGSAAYPSEEKVLSTNAVLVDMDDGRVIAAKRGNERINPASMTKILTVLVAAEHVVNLDDTYLIDISITDYAYRNDCSAVGFAQNEVVTIRDLMYGTILPSGADAALALAEYVAGDQDRFVEMMNDKLEELGLSDTAHFTNCVGIYNENHYCTLTDMAMIMKAAVENELAREILTAHTYTTSSTEEHPDGITISNWFLRRIEDKDTRGEVICAKTGFVKESGCCAASYEISESGKHYICVTADAWSSWRCIYDHVAMYDTYVD